MKFCFISFRFLDGAVDRSLADEFPGRLAPREDWLTCSDVTSESGSNSNGGGTWAARAVIGNSSNVTVLPCNVVEFMFSNGSVTDTVTPESCARTINQLIARKNDPDAPAYFKNLRVIHFGYGFFTYNNVLRAAVHDAFENGILVVAGAGTQGKEAKIYSGGLDSIPNSIAALLILAQQSKPWPTPIRRPGNRFDHVIAVTSLSMRGLTYAPPKSRGIPS